MAHEPLSRLGSFSWMMQIEVNVCKEKFFVELFAKVPFIYKEYINMLYGGSKVGLT